MKGHLQNACFAAKGQSKDRPIIKFSKYQLKWFAILHIYLLLIKRTIVIELDARTMGVVSFWLATDWWLLRFITICNNSVIMARLIKSKPKWFDDNCFTRWFVDHLQWIISDVYMYFVLQDICGSCGNIFTWTEAILKDLLSKFLVWFKMNRSVINASKYNLTMVRHTLCNILAQIRMLLFMPKQTYWKSKEEVISVSFDIYWLKPIFGDLRIDVGISSVKVILVYIWLPRWGFKYRF